MTLLIAVAGVGVVYFVGMAVSSRIRHGLSDEWYRHNDNVEWTKGVDMATSGNRKWNAPPKGAE